MKVIPNTQTKIQHHLNRNSLNLRHGTRIQGKVIKTGVEGFKLQLMSGEIIDAALIGDKSVSLGKTYSFAVEEIKATKLLLSLVNGNSDLCLKQETIRNLLLKLDLPINRSTETILEALLKQGMPLTKKKILRVYKSVMAINELIDNKENGFKGMIPSTASILDVEFQNQISDVESSHQDQNKPIEKKPINTLDTLFPNNHVTNKDISRFVYLMKCNLPLNLKNIDLLKKTMQGQNIIEEAIESINKAFENSNLHEYEAKKNVFDLTTSLLNDLTHKRTKDKSIYIHKMIEEFEKNIFKNMDYEEGAKEIEQLKYVSKFIEQVNQHATIIPLIIPLDYQVMKDATLILNKKNRRHNKDEKKVYLALNTKHLGCVKVMCRFYGKEVNIDFELENTRIEHYIKKEFKVLLQSLEGLGFDNKISTRVKSSKVNLIEALEDPNSTYYIMNLKV